MCGIYGVITSDTSKYSKKLISKTISELAYLSESRGKDSSGLCIFNQNKKSLNVLKGPIPTKELFSNIKTKMLIKNNLTNNSNFLAFGHSRLVTNGSQLDQSNNQPIIKDGIVAVHNGIIANVDELWKSNNLSKRENEIDTEVLLSLIRNEINLTNSVEKAVSSSINKIKGTVALALSFDDSDEFILATNNGSLYTIHNNKDFLIFASEYQMLTSFKNKNNLELPENYSISQLKSNRGIKINLKNFKISNFSLNYKKQNKEIKKRYREYQINTEYINPNSNQLPAIVDLNKIHLNSKSKEEIKLLQYPIEKIKKLKRCKKCILPDTFPFLFFDELGICNYCNNYVRKNISSSLKDLDELVSPYRKVKGKPDVLIPISGGRDSTYVLHVIKNELNMNVVTYTYDWGMVTDLARRNIARICGELGVENIIVAADIHWKRQNIKKNILAWLKNPHLGMIPLFMAGDKFFFYYANKIKKQIGIDLEIWGVNDLENTNFKTGFAGLEPQFNKKRIYSLSIKNQCKLFAFVASNLVKSPGYINQSVLDSLGSYASRYITPKANYFHLFDYMQWNEKMIENTIIDNYNWEKAVDTRSTWRIGDGTASFYNYIYVSVVGFSENDTFRSNQIREGMISREQALNYIYEENKPRYNSLKWYLEILGLDYSDVIKKINSIPSKY